MSNTEMALAGFVSFYDELDRINGRMECNWSMMQALDEIKAIVKRSRTAKARKADLLAELDHIESHLSGDVKVMCNDVKDRLQ